MYDFELRNKEKIKMIIDDVFLKVDKNVDNVSVVITNIRLIILRLPKDIESFRFGKMINYPFIKETIFETEIKNIKKISHMKDFDKYTLDNDSYFFLNSNEIFKLIKEIINK